MRHLIVYDISPDDVRLAVANLLEGVGVRVQESGFECDLEAPALAFLVERLTTVLGVAQNGQIRVYPVCHDCYGGAFGLGDIVSDGARSAIIVG